MSPLHVEIRKMCPNLNEEYTDQPIRECDLDLKAGLTTIGLFVSQRVNIIFYLMMMILIGETIRITLLTTSQPSTDLTD